MKWIRGLPWSPGRSTIHCQGDKGYCEDFKKVWRGTCLSCEYPLTSVAGLIFNPTPFGVRSSSSTWRSWILFDYTFLSSGDCLNHSTVRRCWEVFWVVPYPHTIINLHISSHESVLVHLLEINLLYGCDYHSTSSCIVSYLKGQLYSYCTCFLTGS